MARETFYKGARYVNIEDDTEHIIVHVYEYDNQPPVIEFMAADENDQGPLFWQIESELLKEQGYQPKF